MRNKYLCKAVLLFFMPLLVSSCICTSGDVECNDFSKEEQAWLPYTHRYDTLTFKSSNGRVLQFECQSGGFHDPIKKKGVYLYSCVDDCEKVFSSLMWVLTDSVNDRKNYQLQDYLTLRSVTSKGYTTINYGRDSFILNSSNTPLIDITVGGKVYPVIEMTLTDQYSVYKSIFINKGLGILRMDLKTNNEILERIL